ncbi:MAG: tetratricopeptide repeat protein [Planctomycetota bacterium]
MPRRRPVEKSTNHVAVGERIDFISNVRANLPVALLLMAATLLVYLPALGAEFIWDDDAYLTNNAVLVSPNALARIWFEPTATIQYYPLVFTSFWVEHHLWGLNPAGYHLVNILLHGIASVLVWRVLGRMEVPGAAWAAAVFALHPVHVESVAWVTERKNVLSIVFYLLALRAYLPLISTNAVGAERPALAMRSYVVALLFFVFALLSKTSTVTFPIVLLIITWWRTARIRLVDFMRAAPFFAVSLVAGLVTSYVEKHHVGAAEVDWTLTAAQRVLLAGRAACFYLGKLVVPVDLAFIYNRWTIDTAVPLQWVWPFLVVVVLITLAILHRRIGRGPVVAALYFVVTLMPILGFVNFFFMGYSFVADHFQYLASLGPITLLCGLAHASYRRAVRTASIVVLVTLGAMTFHRAGVFRNSVSLWTDVLAKSPLAARMAHENLAVHYSDRGLSSDAIPHFEAALAIKPDTVDARLSYAVALHAVGRGDDAITQLNDVRRQQPDNFIAAVNLGLFLSEKGRLEEALSHYMQAIRLKPDFATAHFNLARLYVRLGRTADAMMHYREAVRLDPTDAEAARELDQLVESSRH